ncbi:MAG: hypothetical protein NTZ35_16450 [Ignavibacteriales bacterium]|nr:hypothetical protein [Ignavibacteriales bacterium]
MATSRNTTARNFIERFGVHGLLRILQDANEGIKLEETAKRFGLSMARMSQLRDSFLVQRWILTGEARDAVKVYLDEAQSIVDKEKEAFEASRLQASQTQEVLESDMKLKADQRSSGLP